MGALLRHPAIRKVQLVGSRAEGRATDRSDWDFRIEVDEFEAVAHDLPRLLAPLDPIAEQWDRLSTEQCWMLTLAGPVKVDLIFAEEPHDSEPPWVADAENLEAMDRHFWDWMLWLSSKEAKGERDVVTRELGKLFEHLLAPLGVDRQPRSIAEAVEAYRSARDRSEVRFGVKIPRRLEAEVWPAVTA
jgi:hypothetical protein